MQKAESDTVFAVLLFFAELVLFLPCFVLVFCLNRVWICFGFASVLLDICLLVF